MSYAYSELFQNNQLLLDGKKYKQMLNAPQWTCFMIVLEYSKLDNRENPHVWSKYINMHEMSVTHPLNNTKQTTTTTTAEQAG